MRAGGATFGVVLGVLMNSSSPAVSASGKCSRYSLCLHGTAPAHGNSGPSGQGQAQRTSEFLRLQSPEGPWLAQLKSPPVDGKANQELIAVVAKHFGCAKTSVSIKSGASGRMKLVQVEL